MHGYIYETTNLVNGRKYIGQHTSSTFDPNYKGSGKLLRQAFEKYGWSNFSVRMLCLCFSQEELDAEEIDYIAHCNAVESQDYYNLQAGGQVGNIAGSRMSKSTKHRMRIAHLGKHHTEQAKQKISKANSGIQNWKGKHHSEETKLKISEAQQGELNHAYGKPWSEERKADRSRKISGEGNPCYGKKCYNNGKHNIYILPSEIEYYTSLGYVKGKIKKGR